MKSRTSPPSLDADSEECKGYCHQEGELTAHAATRLLQSVAGATQAPLVRIGVDACNITALQRQLATSIADAFLNTIYTASELDYCNGRVERLATRWAAKEAVAKAIGSGFRGLRPSQIEICRQSDGMPYVKAAGNHSWPNRAEDWTWSISLAHEEDVAVAVALAIVRPQEQHHQQEL
ncbi:holo-ACP synthase [Streptosporangium sp. H16]|uniref:holo-ACP synthase n=1 Tax=Streptosporangium sp. H16 TaxID=3444184 RepID=UPI003F7A3BC4